MTTDAKTGVAVTMHVQRALQEAGFDAADFILCVWHGGDELAVLASGVPPEYLAKGLADALKAVKSGPPPDGSAYVVRTEGTKQ